MTATPWGEAERLAARKLPPGPGGDREAIARQQRERLFGAMVAVVAEKGYEATRVEDVLVLAGVSRNAFYKLFTSKRDCFVRMLEEVERHAGPVMLAPVPDGDDRWDLRLRALLDRLAALLVSQPALARAAWVEVYAAGPDAVAVVERIDRTVERAVSAALDESPERAGMPRAIVRALVGAVRKLVHDRVRSGRVGELPALMGDVFDWLNSYLTPPRPLRRPRRVPAELLPAERPPADARERILVAVTEIVAAKGYPEMAITEIAGRAAVSLTTFYHHFDGKEDAFLEAFWRGHRIVFETVAPVVATAADWETSVALGARALTGCQTAMPEIATLGGVGVWATSPAGMEVRYQAIDTFKAFLDEGFRLHPDTPATARDGIAAAVDALMYETLRHRGAERMYEIAPTFAYIVLAPFVGAERACELANAEVDELRGGG